MNEAEALRFFLKLVSACGMLFIAIVWVMLGLLHRTIRRRRTDREQMSAVRLAE